MLIRQETPADYLKVYALIRAAFETAEHSDHNEHNLANALRKSKSFVPQLSLVAEIDGEIAGHILFTEGKVGSQTVLILAPLSVSPRCQKSGVGTSLIAEAHKIAKKIGYHYSFVLGSAKYYPKFGYLPAACFGVSVAEGIPEENFMAIRFSDSAPQLRGKLLYAPEFGI